MKKHEPIKPFLGAANVCAALCACITAPIANAQTAPKPPAAPLPAPAQIPLKGDTTLVTTDTQVPMPASMVLRGSLKADKKMVKAGEPVTFTYSVTNTSRTAPQSLRFSTSQRFDIMVQPKTGGAVAWQFSKGQMFMMALGMAAFAPGETKTFTATWKPAPGEIKPGASYMVMAHLTPTGSKTQNPSSPQTAHATLVITAAK